MRRLWTPAWLARHALAAALVAACLLLAGWQLSRATGGNALSWGYTLQWPIFAGFVAVLWLREVRRAVRDAGAGAPPPETALTGPPAPNAGPTPAARRPVITRRVHAGTPYDDRGDADLAAYNHYLRWLADHPGARPADYPGPAAPATATAPPATTAPPDTADRPR
jgi:hypothetical protein